MNENRLLYIFSPIATIELVMSDELNYRDPIIVFELVSVSKYWRSAMRIGQIPGVGTRICHPKILYSLSMLLLTLVFVALPVTQCRAAGESLLPQHQSYKSFAKFSVILARGNGTILVAGPQSHDISKKGMPAIAIVDANHQLGKLTRIGLPARKAQLLSVHIERGHRLSNGDILLVGYVRAVRGKRLLGWAARLNSNFKTLWSKVWRQVQTRSEQLYFGVEAAGNEILLGGKSAKGRGCSGDSKGVLLRLNGANGRLIGSRKFYGAAKVRQGFRDGKMLEEGALVMVGWRSPLTQAGTRCFDDIWVAETDQTGNLRKQAIFKKRGDDVPFMLNRLGNNMRLVGYSQTSENREDNVYGLDVIFNRSQNIKILQQEFISIKSRSRNFFNFAKPLKNSRMLLAGGFVTHNLKAPPSAGLRLVADRGQCGGTFIPHQTDYQYARVTSATQLQNGSVIVSGRLWNSTKDSVGWLIWLSRGNIGNVELGDLRAGTSLFDLNRIRSAGAALYKFSVSSAVSVRLILRQIEGDVDAVLMTRQGKIIALSDNKKGASDLIEARLEAGHYNLQIATARPRATYSLETSILGDGALPSSQGDEVSYRSNAVVQSALHQLGYRVGTDIDAAYGSEIQKAIKAFKASLCAPVDDLDLSTIQKSRLVQASTLSKALASKSK